MAAWRGRGGGHLWVGDWGVKNMLVLAMLMLLIKLPYLLLLLMMTELLLLLLQPILKRLAPALSS